MPNEYKVVLIALTELGILVPQSRDKYLVDSDRLSATAEYRRGVKDALISQGLYSKNHQEAKICVATPTGIQPEVEKDLRQGTLDLRSALIDLIIGSQNSIVLASPFWDSKTLADLAIVLERGLQAGVQVSVLGRFNNKADMAVKLQLVKLAEFPNFCIFDWYETNTLDPFGALTFHFKAVISDAGERAYLGKANFTVSSLRSRMEIGVILEGESALHLSRIVNTVLSIAKPTKWVSD